MNPQLNNLQVYCINLARAKDRRNSMQKKLDALGLAYELLDATDERIQLNTEEIKLIGEHNLPKYKKEISPGETGCLMSHLRCYQKLLETGDSYALILEDDASLSPDFVPVLKGVLNASKRWDLINLGYIVGGGPPPYIGKDLFPLSFMRAERLVIPTDKLKIKCDYHIGSVAANIFASHCYIISRNGSKFMLKNFNNLILSIDSLFNQLAIPSRLALFPEIAYQPISVNKGDLHGDGDIKYPQGIGVIPPFRKDMGILEKIFRIITRISPVWIHRMKRTLFVLFFKRPPSYYRNLLTSIFRRKI